MWGPMRRAVWCIAQSICYKGAIHFNDEYLDEQKIVFILLTDVLSGQLSGLNLPLFGVWHFVCLRKTQRSKCGARYGVGGGVTIGIGRGVGVAVSIGFNDIGTGESVLVGGGAAVGIGVVSATVGVADGAGAVVSTSGDLEHELNRTTLIRVKKAASGGFMIRTILSFQHSIKSIMPWPLERSTSPLISS